VGDDSNAVDQVWNLIALPGAPTRKDLEEGGGIEPLCFTTPRFSGPVAGHSAAPSEELAQNGVRREAVTGQLMVRAAPFALPMSKIW